MIELAQYEIMVAELYRGKEIVGTDNDKEKIVCSPKSFLPLPSKIYKSSLIRNRHNFEHNAIVGPSSIMPVMAIFSP